MVVHVCISIRYFWKTGKGRYFPSIPEQAENTGYYCLCISDDGMPDSHDTWFRIKLPNINKFHATMLQTLHPNQHPILASLFEDFNVLKGLKSASLHCGMGEATIAGNLESPSVASILTGYGFLFFGGDPAHASAIPLIRQVIRKNSTVVAMNNGWLELVKTCYPGKIHAYNREAFDSVSFEQSKLKKWRQRLPEHCELTPITLQDIPQWIRFLDPDLVRNFPSHKAFIRDSFGFGIFDRSRKQWIAGISGAIKGKDCVEIEIQVHPEHQRKGLGTSIASAFILYCQEIQITPCWDAHNSVSAALAKKLGYQSEGQYEVLELN